MTFDTFDSYNTDEAYKDKGTTAKGLVDAYKKDNPNGSADDFYAKLNKTWAQDKDGHVKNAVNEAFKTKEEVKEEPKAEEKTAPKVEEMTQTTEALKPEEPKKEEKPSLENEDTGIKKSDKSYLDEINSIYNEEQKQELQKLAKTSVDSYNRTIENMQKQGDAFKSIDDKLIDQLPTFMWKRYQNGEFGKPESTDAKLRLAYFGINNIVSKLKMIANADAAARGQGTLFQNTESAYDQYQNSNLAKGLENRWNKYNQETQSAIDLVKNRGIENEEALNIVNKISMNNRLQTAYNMADANKKAYMIEVLSKVGDKVSNWNDSKFVNALVGAEMTGEDVGNAVALIGTRAGEKILDNFNLIDENGNLDLSALKNIKDLPGIKEAFAEKGIDIDKFDFDTAGVGGSLISGNKGKESTGVTLEDGTKIDPGKTMSKKELESLRAEAKKLGDKLYNGEITEEQFRKDYVKLENVMSQHGIRNAVSGGIMSADNYLKQIQKNKRIELSDQIDALNEKAKKGKIDASDYNEQFNALKEQASKWGVSEKELKSIDKGKVKFKK